MCFYFDLVVFYNNKNLFFKSLLILFLGFVALDYKFIKQN